MNRKLSAFFLLIGLSASGMAQEQETIENAFQGTRLVNGQSANLADKNELLLLIQHRFGDISGGVYDMFGLDYASMRLGFEYGIGEHVNIGIGRSTWLKTFDGFGKVRLIRQSETFPLSAVLSAGASLPSIRDYFPEEHDNFADKLSLNAQLHLSGTIGKLGLQLSPGYMKSSYLPESGQELSFFTLGMGASFKFSKKVSASLEYLVPFDEMIPGENALSLGVDLDTGGHLFQLIVSNNQRMYDQALYTNTTGEWAAGHLFFGFNLIREFKLKYY